MIFSYLFYFPASKTTRAATKNSGDILSAVFARGTRRSGGGACRAIMTHGVRQCARDKGRSGMSSSRDRYTKQRNRNSWKFAIIAKRI